MEKENYPQYAKHFSVLDFRVQKWHVERLYHKDFAASRGAVHSRLDGLLADPFFAAMFSDPRNKLDLFDELNLPKVILVNTDGLGGALEAFGRLFISKLDEAMIKRKAIPKSSKLPVYFYIDEASDYIKDEPIVGKIINKLGKQKLGMIIAVQGTEQITSTPARDALQRAPIQCWTLKSPIVNISQDRLEPVQVTVPWIAIISWLPHRLRNPSAAQLMQPTIRHVCHHCGAEQQSKRGQNHELSPRHHTYSWPSL